MYLVLNENESLQSLNSAAYCMRPKSYILYHFIYSTDSSWIILQNIIMKQKVCTSLQTLITYAKAVENDDGAAQADICNRLLELHKNGKEASVESIESTYVNEVAEAIYAIFRKRSIEC